MSSIPATVTTTKNKFEVKWPEDTLWPSVTTPYKWYATFKVALQVCSEHARFGDNTLETFLTRYVKVPICNGKQEFDKNYVRGAFENCNLIMKGNDLYIRVSVNMRKVATRIGREYTRDEEVGKIFKLPESLSEMYVGYGTCKFYELIYLGTSMSPQYREFNQHGVQTN